MDYRIGTRGSKLALVQANGVKSRLAAAYPGDTFEIVVVTTHGDRVTDRPIAELGGGAFAHELERALLNGEVDLAVHSMKDLAVTLPDGLVLAKAWTRGDPRDALVCRAPAKSLADLPSGAVVATGSPRRAALLRRMRPDLVFTGIRGNVDTRLRKLFEPGPDEPRLDALVLAAAGLKRLGREDVISEYLDPSVVIPAANQGQIAIELRACDAELKAKIDALGDDHAEAVATAEREFLREAGADCHLPIGAFAEFRVGRFTLHCVSGPAEGPVTVEHRTAGEVTLVGAGPGDPELVTVKGLNAIRAAEVLVYDRLVSSELVGAAPASCERIYVGKKSGHHSLPQDEINALLLAKAISGRRVVRLKGGDPFVFGRGGEEMAYLLEHGVECRAIPGVTSAVAGPAAFGIPVTHRGVANGFEVVTAHAKNDEPLALDYARMLDVSRTYVFLMGLARVREIASGLVSAGRAATTPAAVVSAATMPEAKCAEGTLTDIGDRSQAAGCASPAILVVGDVVSLRGRLGFPCAGRRFLVPVIEGGSRRIPGLLRALGGEVDERIVGRIVRIDGALSPADLEGVDRIVLTSENGRLGLTDEILAVVRAKGIRVERVREVKPDVRTLHLTQPDAPRVSGVRHIDVYRNDPVPIEGEVDLSRYDAALFACASSVERIFAAAHGSTRCAAIGARTHAALERQGVEDIVTAAEPTAESLVRACAVCNTTTKKGIIAK